MLNFCTLFDSNFLSRGIAMYESLKKHCLNFHLYIFAFDDKSLELLNKLELPNITVISLLEFEDEELLKIKNSRSKGEYCWTCTPSTILYVIKKYNVDSCTYLDADLYFFSDPKILIDELKDKSVMITSHRYTPKYDQSKFSGKYCVQFMTFKNNKKGLEVLNWWRNACLEWCYNRYEDGKFGDQKYLDDWTERFDCVHELEHLGGGMAPWNIQQYKVLKKEDKLFAIEKSSGKEFKVIFYHFHNLNFTDYNLLLIGSYELSFNIKSLIYKTHLKHLQIIKSKIYQIDKSFDPHGRAYIGFSYSLLARNIYNNLRINLLKKR